MSHQHHVDPKLVEYRRQFLSSLEDIAVVCMARCGVYRVMEDHRLPSHIRIRRDCLFHKCFMLRRGHIVGIDVHEQGVVVYEPVICSCVRCSVLCALIGQIKVLIVRCAVAVMVPDRCHACEG